MAIDIFPDWLCSLDHEDLVFIKKFILSSGSLKEIAQSYQVSYPTVRLRLDRLIQKIQINDDISFDPYVALIKTMAVNEQITTEAAKKLISEFKSLKKKERRDK